MSPRDNIIVASKNAFLLCFQDFLFHPPYLLFEPYDVFISECCNIPLMKNPIFDAAIDLIKVCPSEIT